MASSSRVQFGSRNDYHFNKCSSRRAVDRAVMPSMCLPRMRTVVKAEQQKQPAGSGRTKVVAIGESLFGGWLYVGKGKAHNGAGGSGGWRI